ncbi:MAG: hypothetical protein JXQ29_09620 [Planctomycetes bacterium]|nr:hypothetical protein [Planctomycetota bacterium]
MCAPRILRRGLLAGWLALALLGAAPACSTPDAIVKLPPPSGLPHLTELDHHLDYQDPDDGKPDYIPRRAR